MANRLFIKNAQVKEKSTPNKNIIFAVTISIAPEAMGRLDFWGWFLSSSISTMSLKIYNTLSRKKEDFTPVEKGKLKIYVCGMTVYSDAHIGHARTYFAFDVIRRYFEYKDMMLPMFKILLMLMIK